MALDGLLLHQVQKELQSFLPAKAYKAATDQRYRAAVYKYGHHREHDD